MDKVISNLNSLEELKQRLEHSFHSHTKGIFSSDEFLANIVVMELEKKWLRKLIRGWGRIYGQLSILFEGRI